MATIVQDKGANLQTATKFVQDYGSKFQDQLHHLVPDALTHPQDEPDAVPHVNLLGGLHDARRNNPMTDEEKENAQYSNSFFGKIAAHKYFELTTMFFICLNALAIGVDADYSARNHKPKNLYKGPMFFIVIEFIFATYFTIELTIRFIAYSNKLHSLSHDRWFQFDSCLVALMVAETWILPNFGDGGPFKGLSILRLLRLARISRMARLMRACPEMVLLVKGMAAAVRAVVWTVILLLLCAFTFAVIFTNEYHLGKLTDEDATEAQIVFGDVGHAFFSLLIMGTILDDLTYCMDAVRSSGKDYMVLAFLFFILISSFMMLNMFLGILVEVVAQSSDGEKLRMQAEFFREAVNETVQEMDMDHDKKVTKREYFRMVETEKVFKTLEQMDVQRHHLDSYGELLFDGATRPNEGSGLTYRTIADTVLRLRPDAPVQTLDFNALSNVYLHKRTCQHKQISDLEKKARELRAAATESASKKGAVALAANNHASSGQAQIGVDTLARLDAAPTWCIVRELQRRLCVADFGETISVHMLDEELQGLVGLVPDAWQG
jgi:voltage-gated sodium channel